MARLDRTDVQALIPEVVSNSMIQGLQNKSVAFTMLRRIPMPTNRTRFPILAALPQAYWVDGDTGLKGTTNLAWDNKYIDVAELATIVPIPEAVLEDSSYDIWGTAQPLIEDAVARAIDSAVIFGINKPAVWPTAIAVTADALNYEYVRGTHTPAQGGISEDFNSLFAQVEAQGFDVNGVVAHTRYKSLLRGARNAQGDQLDEVNATAVYGAPLTYPMRGLWPTGSGAIEAVAGDWTQAILGVRKDFTYKMLDQAVITDSQNNILYNLAQQDMVAMRVVFRCGFQIANLINYDNQNAATRYPFAVMKAP